MTFDGIDIWTVSFAESQATRINTATGAGINVALPPGGAGPIGVMFDGINIWTTNNTSANVSRLLP